MITTEPTQEMFSEWKRIYDLNISRMQPNRKTGLAVDKYFCSRYVYEKIKNDTLEQVVRENIALNDIYRERLQHGKSPIIRLYSVKDALVGIDLETGFFQVESQNSKLMAQIWDDLFLFRGLDEQDLKNYVLTGQYIQLSMHCDIHR